MDNTMNNESTVSDDNGMTYTASFTHTAWVKGTVWSIGLGCEVQVVGHSSDQQEDVWMVTRDIDGDGSPDSAMRRAGSDLAPVYRIGDVVTIFVQTSSDTAPELTYGIVATRSPRGVYVHTGYTMFNGNGAVCIDWEDARTRFERGEEFQLVRNQTSYLLNLLQSNVSQQSKRAEDIAQEADRIREELEDFKVEVARKMKSLAVEHGWCGVAREGLEDLGLDWPTTRWAVDVTFTGTVYIDAEDEDAATGRVQYLIDGCEVNYSSNTDDDNFEVGSFEKEVGSAEPSDD